MLTQKILKEYVEYFPETGKFISTNRYAGKEIGSAGNGYIRLRIRHKTYLAHRLAFLYTLGEIPKGIDHIDGNGYNNTWSNLREADQSQNTMNTRIRSDNKTGVKGICFVNRTCPYYKVAIKANGSTISRNFGIVKYSSKEKALEAAIAFIKELREKMHGEFTNHG